MTGERITNGALSDTKSIQRLIVFGNRALKGVRVYTARG